MNLTPCYLEDKVLSLHCACSAISCLPSFKGSTAMSKRLVRSTAHGYRCCYETVKTCLKHSTILIKVERFSAPNALADMCQNDAKPVNMPLDASFPFKPMRIRSFESTGSALLCLLLSTAV